MGASRSSRGWESLRSFSEIELLVRNLWKLPAVPGSSLKCLGAARSSWEFQGPPEGSLNLRDFLGASTSSQAEAGTLEAPSSIRELCPLRGAPRSPTFCHKTFSYQGVWGVEGAPISSHRSS